MHLRLQVMMYLDLLIVITRKVAQMTQTELVTNVRRHLRHSSHLPQEGEELKYKHGRQDKLSRVNNRTANVKQES